MAHLFAHVWISQELNIQYVISTTRALSIDCSVSQLNLSCCLYNIYENELNISLGFGQIAVQSKHFEPLELGEIALWHVSLFKAVWK